MFKVFWNCRIIPSGPCGNGTETYEKWEMRLHRRVIDISADDKVIRQLMRLRIPDDGYIELLLT